MSLYKENYSKYIAEYTRNNYDRLELRLPKGYKKFLKEKAKPLSMNKFILESIEEKIERMEEK